MLGTLDVDLTTGRYRLRSESKKTHVSLSSDVCRSFSCLVISISSRLVPGFPTRSNLANDRFCFRGSRFGTLRHPSAEDGGTLSDGDIADSHAMHQDTTPHAT